MRDTILCSEILLAASTLRTPRWLTSQMTSARLERIGAIRPDPRDPSALRIDETLVRRMLVAFLREEAKKSGHKRVVVAVSGGVDSAAVAALAADAFGAANVTALFLPYRTSDAASGEHARLVASAFGL